MRFFLVLLPLSLVALPVLSRGSGGPKYLQAAPEAKPKLEPLDFAPFGYFDAKCARCHGIGGSNYGDVLKGKDDAALHAGIDRMAKGPGQAPLDEPRLRVLTDWHRALAEGKPFAHLMQIEPKENGGATLTGEATPEAKVALESGGQSFEAKRDEARWTIELPAGVDLQAATLTASAAE